MLTVTAAQGALNLLILALSADWIGNLRINNA